MDFPDNDGLRLDALKEYKLLDTPCEEIFDNIVRATAIFCHVPVSLINLIDQNRQFTKSSHGLNITDLPREDSFCSYTILGPDILEVQDTYDDSRFKHNPLVTNDPSIRFYCVFASERSRFRILVERRIASIRSRPLLNPIMCGDLFTLQR